jgi:AcrR family transcriptional regulator
MRSKESADADLTTRARIRDAGIAVFGEQGFGAGVRAVAIRAGVSPGLVNHHFGSKDGLRAACDEWVLAFIRTEKAKTGPAPTPAGIITALAEIDIYAPVVAYILRSFTAGGPLAESLLEQMVADAAQLLRDGVAAGTLKPSRDPLARARYITMSHVGAMNLHLQLVLARDGKVDYTKEIRILTNLFALPALEMYTQGMLTNSSLLETLTKEQE